VTAAEVPTPAGNIDADDEDLNIAAPSADVAEEEDNVTAEDVKTPAANKDLSGEGKDKGIYVWWAWIPIIGPILTIIADHQKKKEEEKEDQDKKDGPDKKDHPDSKQ